MQTNEFVDYLTSEGNHSPHTVAAYLTDLKQFIEMLGRNEEVKHAKDVTAKEVRQWLVELHSKDISNRSIVRKITTLRTYFDFLERRGEITLNPMQKIVAPRMQKKAPEYVLTEEMERLLEAKEQGEGFEGLRDSIVLELLYATGMRQAEILSIEEKDIDFAQNQLRIMGKRRKQRIIPLNPTLLDRIKDYIDQKHALAPQITAFLVDNNLEPMSKYQLYYLVKKSLLLVNTSSTRSPHVLRHSFATNTLSEGADLNSIKEILGHENIMATEIYTHTTIEELKKVYKQAHPKASEQ